LQNFFAVVKALVAEANENSTASDGQHHYEASEIDLMSKYAHRFISASLEMALTFVFRFE